MIKNEDEKIITLDVFNDSITANFAKDKLKQNGIEAFLEYGNSADLNSTVTIKLMIFSKDLEKAFEILSE
jgi:hypothetical protein